MSNELKFDMLRWQRTVINDPTRFKVVVAGRRTGKTRFSVVNTIIKALECSDRTAGVMCIAPTFSMARVLVWDLLCELGRPVITKASINNAEITFINGVKVYVRGADNPDSLRGVKLYHVTLDEFQDVKDQVWEYIVRPALSDMKGTALFIGTPKPDAERFRKLYDLGVSGQDDEWQSWLFKTVDNELIDPKEIEAARKSMSTPAYLQEYEASWDTAGANVLRLEWFEESEQPKGEHVTYLTIDPAGYESVAVGDTKKKHLDYFAIAVVKVFENGHWWVQKIDYGRWDVREAAVRVLMAIRNHKPMAVGMEKGALMRAFMPYMQDLMRKNALYCHIEPIATSGQSKIDRITYALQGLMEHGRITFNRKEDWMEVKKEMIAFPSKRAHDDLLDALSMVAHMHTTIYGEQREQDEYEVIDPIVGF